MRKSLLSIACAGTLCVTGTAHAAFVYVDDSAPARSTFTIGDVNEFRSELAAGGATEFVVGASLALDAPGSVQVDYFGEEAVFTNSFQWGGSTVATTPDRNVDPWMQRPVGSFGAGAGVLDFGFCTDGGQIGDATYPPACQSNADADAAAIDPAQSIGSWVSPDGNVAWLLWDDGGGGAANSHDDMVMRLTYSPAQVPEPTTLGLLGLGMLAGVLGTTRRTRRET